MKPTRYHSIQYLRGLAAIAVLLSHVLIFEKKYTLGPTIAPLAFQYGMAGVDLFFVISGFIIATVTKGLLGENGEAVRFLAHRFIRIYPIYWLYYGALLIVYLIAPQMINSSYAPPNLLTSFLLLPDRSVPLLAVSWTLSYEIFFYSVFALIVLWSRQKYLISVLSLWAAATVTGALLLETDSPLLNLVFRPYVLEFIAGCFIAHLVPKLGRAAGFSLLAAGIGILLIGTIFLQMHYLPYPGEWERVLLYGSGFTLLVAGSASLERVRNGRHVSKSLLLLGDASYSLYLSHVLVLSAFGHLWSRVFAHPGAMNHAIALTIALAAAVAWGLISYRFIEAPLLRFLRARIPA